MRLLARFRVELRLVAGAEELECEDVMLEVRLQHARSTTHFVPDGDAEAQSLTRFNEVAVQRLRLRLPQPEAACFFPCTFDDAHFCYLALTAHVALIEFKLRTSSKTHSGAHAVARGAPSAPRGGRGPPSLRASSSFLGAASDGVRALAGTRSPRGSRFAASDRKSVV